ncbi:MAG: N-acetyltransferase [Alistipes sp.]|nr:N-acetyltransferase [Alistipes sp.]
MSTFDVRHKPESCRFEILRDGRTGWVEYVIEDGCLNILHTIVPVQLENMGIGSALVRAAYDWGRGEGLTPEGSCHFAHLWLQRHPEYR